MTQNIQEIWDTIKRPNLRKVPFQSPRNHLKQTHRRKLPKPKERDAYKHIRSLQNTKHIVPEKTTLLPYNNQNTKYPEQQQKKNIKNCK